MSRTDTRIDAIEARCDDRLGWVLKALAANPPTAAEARTHPFESFHCSEVAALCVLARAAMDLEDLSPVEQAAAETLGLR